MTRQTIRMQDEGATGVDPLTEEALAWLARLHSGEETDADWHLYADWKAIDQAHVDAAARAEQIWDRLGSALRPNRKGGKVLGGIGIAVLLVGASASLGAFGPPSGWFADEATGFGERRTVELADGSAIVLDSATSFDIAYSRRERRIVLRDGQVYITVQPDPARPFVVEAGGGAVQALGTAFNVRMAHDGVRVDVTQHAVRVSAADTPSVDVEQGQGVGFTRRSIGAPAPIDIAAVTAWTHGEIVFDDRPLGDVVTEIGRYRSGSVVFTDAALKKLTVTGVFNTTDTDDFFDALEQTLPVRVIRLPLITLIRPSVADAPASSQ
jgi:transmembrane sensor